MKTLKLKTTIAELNSHGSALIQDADSRGGRSTEGLFNGRKTPEGTERQENASRASDTWGHARGPTYV